MSTVTPSPLLHLENLHIYPQRKDGLVRSVDGADLEIARDRARRSIAQPICARGTPLLQAKQGEAAIHTAACHLAGALLPEVRT